MPVRSAPGSGFVAPVQGGKQIGMLELDIEDHGAGLHAGTPASNDGGIRRGLGLVAMRERAELIGGTLEVERPREGGTVIRLQAPMKAPVTAA